MKRGLLCGPAAQRTCLMIPGILFSAVVLATMIVNMCAAFSALRAEPVVHLYPAEQTEPQQISFPFTIQGTTLVAERMAVYDGPYVEDGSNTEVTGIAALVLRNQGQQTVARAEITLEQGTRRLVFRADTIPAGAAVLVLEVNKSPYKAEAYQSCYGSAVIDDSRIVLPSDIRAEVSDMNCIAVTNMTDMTLTGVLIYHKGWLAEPGIYIGGITYQTSVGTLMPGQSASVYPAYYAEGYSRIVQITHK